MQRLAHWCSGRRRVVVAVWVLALALLGVGVSLVGADFTKANSGSDVTTGTMVFQAPTPVDAQPYRSHIETMVARVSDVAGVQSATSPFTATDQLSDSKQVAYISITASTASPDTAKELADIADATTGPDAPPTGMSQALGGQLVKSPIAVSEWSEIIGITGALIVLLVMFRSAWAAALPIITGGAGVGAGLLSAMLASHVIPLPDSTPTLGALIGLGVGIDYALFITYRYRKNLLGGATPTDAVVAAMSTSGRAVAFAGVTVVVAMLGMTVLGVDILTGMALGAALTVALTLVAALTLLPALLTAMGTRVLGKRQRAQLLTGTPGTTITTDHRRADRWAEAVTGHPVTVVIIAAAVMIAVAAPALALRLGSADAGSTPDGAPGHAAYSMLSDGFGPGVNGPVILLASVGDQAAEQASDRLVTAISHTDGVQKVSATPTPSGQRIITVIGTHGPQSADTSELVTTLRTQTIPTATAGTGLQIRLTGVTAGNDDFAASLADRIPTLLAVVILLGMLLLLLAFRSITVAVVAALMNVATIGAAFGVVVMVFQWGWGAQLLGIGTAAPIEAVVPVLIIAVVFGLSMDYHVFLVSRIHEEFVRTADNGRAIRTGVSHTAAVLLAAAVIMFSVFAAFAGGGVRLIAEFGLGLAVAVILDVAVVRLCLVPAVMTLIGPANWWLPRWLDRILPHLNIEGTSAADPETTADEKVAHAADTCTVAEASSAPQERTAR